MSWNVAFSGIGNDARKEAQRKLRAERVVTGGSQSDSPKNATLDAVSAVVATVASQFPDGLIEGSCDGHMSVDGGSVRFDIRVREATEGEAETLKEETPAAAPVQETKTDGTQESGRPTQAAGPSNPAPAGVRTQSKPVPPGQDGGTPVGQRPSANPQSSSGSGRTAPGNT